MALYTALHCPAVIAQAYPSKPIRLIVGVAPGGGVDGVARTLANRLQERLAQNVLVDNRAGAGSSIAHELTARATPDGYTLMLATATLVIYPFMTQASFDPLADFAAVTQVVTVPLVLVINAGVPARSAAELIAWAKSKPGSLNFATSGSGSFPHLAGELFKTMSGTDLVHVPYKGNAAIYPDLIAGQTQVGFTAISSAMPHIKSGKLRALAVTSRVRLRSAPELPTLDEAGVRGYDASQWYGVLAPAKTPAAIIDRLQREIVAALQQPDVLARVALEGEPIGSSAEQFARHIRDEHAKWGKLIRQLGIRGG
ncbi:MAG: tripartite tricarboxylate transporter substrate binding protein [Burkholderiales bacterium]|nr:tripartite tricarboxylate transporter substrate binding protein [Burkholderiales bacterium]